jgi:hypothetical protein
VLTEHTSGKGMDKTMALRVKVETQPGEPLRFPPQCVNCGKEAEAVMSLRKRRGRVTREIEAPLCAECERELRRLSGDEERRIRMGWFFGGLALLLGFILFFLLLPAWLSTGWRLAVALLLAVGMGAVVVTVFRRNSQDKARAEKKQVLRAARLEDFSWRATTFAFEDEAYGQQFVALNRERLLETQRVS